MAILQAVPCSPFTAVTLPAIREPWGYCTLSPRLRPFHSKSPPLSRARVHTHAHTFLTKGKLCICQGHGSNKGEVGGSVTSFVAFIRLLFSLPHLSLTHTACSSPYKQLCCMLIHIVLTGANQRRSVSEQEANDVEMKPDGRGDEGRRGDENFWNWQWHGEGGESILTQLQQVGGGWELRGLRLYNSP